MANRGRGTVAETVAGPLCFCPGSSRLPLDRCSIVGSTSQPFAHVRPVEPKISPTAENRQRRTVVLASAPTFLIDPADSNLQPLGQLPWCQNILRFHPVFTRDLRWVGSGLMRLVCQGVTSQTTAQNWVHSAASMQLSVQLLLCIGLFLVKRRNSLGRRKKSLQVFNDAKRLECQPSF